MKYWEIIADNLSKSRMELGAARADKVLTALLELETTLL
jgi:hypothetical protein